MWTSVKILYLAVVFFLLNDLLCIPLSNVMVTANYGSQLPQLAMSKIKC